MSLDVNTSGPPPYSNLCFQEKLREKAVNCVFKTVVVYEVVDEVVHGFFSTSLERAALFTAPFAPTSQVVPMVFHTWSRTGRTISSNLTAMEKK